jgi:GNAT superfamily N-acetyltransferase
MAGQSENREDIQITIRLATEADALLLAQFRYAFRASISPTCETEAEFVQRCSRWMQTRLCAASQWRCWIAERAGVPVGHVWLQLIEKIPNPIVEPEYHAYITNFYVREEARGAGIGSRLLAAALDWAKTQDVQAVILWPTEQSRSLYLRYGFAVRDDLLELLITEQSEE